MNIAKTIYYRIKSLFIRKKFTQEDVRNAMSKALYERRADIAAGVTHNQALLDAIEACKKESEKS